MSTLMSSLDSSECTLAVKGLINSIKYTRNKTDMKTTKSSIWFQELHFLQ